MLCRNRNTLAGCVPPSLCVHYTNKELSCSCFSRPPAMHRSSWLPSSMRNDSLEKSRLNNSNEFSLSFLIFFSFFFLTHLVKVDGQHWMVITHMKLISQRKPFILIQYWWKTIAKGIKYKNKAQSLTCSFTFKLQDINKLVFNRVTRKAHLKGPNTCYDLNDMKFKICTFVKEGSHLKARRDIYIS